MLIENPKSVRFLRVAEVAKRFGVHKSTIWRWVVEIFEFPKPHKLSSGVTRWSVAELEAYERLLEARGNDDGSGVSGASTSIEAEEATKNESGSPQLTLKFRSKNQQ